MSDVDAGALRALLLAREIEQFLFLEADLLDGHRYKEWLDLLTEDVRYFMPIARNVRADNSAAEYTREQQDTNWIDEGKETIRQRVQQIATGLHWAEEPRSRTTHMLSNIRIVEVTPDAESPQEVQVRLHFLVYRNRAHTEVDFYVGKRNDRLRRDGAGWKICRREVILDQTVLLSKNLTTFL